MDEKPREMQPDLFADQAVESKKTERFPALTKTHKPILVSTTLEQILTFSVLAILGLCGIFFLGVLRGKNLERPPAVAPPAAPVQMPVVSAPPASVIAPATQKPYTIQLVTHRKKEFADAETVSLRKLGFVSFIIPSGEYFQVCAGQYASKEEAKKDLSRFASKYKDSYLRRR